MKVKGKVVVVTGAARGIGDALVRRFAAEGAAAIAVSDRDLPAAQELCGALKSTGVRLIAISTDVGAEEQIKALIDEAESTLGPIDLFCSNAGIALGRGLDASDKDWERNWSLNVLSHIYAARYMVPKMIARGGGYLLNTCSGAGLLANADAPYMVSKHAAVAFADWLAIKYHGSGIKVSALCPLGVKTKMLMQGLAAGSPVAKAVIAGGEVLEPSEVADAVIVGLEKEQFLILPQSVVGLRIVRKAIEREAWQSDVAKMFAKAASPN